MSWQRRAIHAAIVVGLLGVLFLVAQYIRRKFGLEYSPASIQEIVHQQGGVWAPLGFILLVSIRQLLALPSVLVLTSAGLLFGAPLGTLLGGLGITCNAFLLFVSARALGGDWVLPRIHERFPQFEARANSAGPLVIAFMTGHPMGVLTPFHLAAGVTGLKWTTFLAAVAPAATFRAACYAFLGAHILEPGSMAFWLATGLLLAATLLPLAHPGLRGRILGTPDREAVD